MNIIKTNPKKAYEVMAKGVGGCLSKPEDFAASAAGVNFYGKERNAEFFKAARSGESGKLITLGGEIWGGFKKLKMDIKYDDLVDTSFLCASELASSAGRRKQDPLPRCASFQ